MHTESRTCWPEEGVILHCRMLKPIHEAFPAFILSSTLYGFEDNFRRVVRKREEIDIDVLVPYLSVQVALPSNNRRLKWYICDTQAI